MALEKECDITLSVIIDLWDTVDNARENGVSLEIISIALRNKIPTDILAKHFSDILLILSEDDKIKFNFDAERICYFPTRKGIKSLHTYSYEKEKENNDLLLNIAVSNGKIQQRLLIVNEALAVSAVVAAIYYILETLRFDWKNYLFSPNLFLTYLYGFGTGLIVCWLYRLIKKKQYKQ